jgi:hypothetical protein
VALAAQRFHQLGESGLIDIPRHGLQRPVQGRVALTAHEDVVVGGRYRLRRAAFVNDLEMWRQSRFDRKAPEQRFAK